MTSVPLFVYGTLKVGEALAGLLPANPHRYHATCRGHLYYAPGTRTYPVFVPSDDADADDVDGEILWVDLTDGDIAYTVIMELSTGYAAEWLDVDFAGATLNGSLKALVFTWSEDDGLGEYIPSADWSFRDETPPTVYRCCECNSPHPTYNASVECQWEHDTDDYYGALAAANDA